MLVARLEPMFLGEPGHPPLELKTYFHLSMLAHHLILDGKAAFEAVYREPARALQAKDALTMASGCYLMALFGYDALVFQARKRRLTRRYSSPSDRARATAGQTRRKQWRSSSSSRARWS